MTRAVRRATPLFAGLLILVFAIGFVGRTCSRMHLRSRSFVAMNHAPAHAR